MKILCVSVHPVLEYDEIQLFEEMGHQIFSLGFYINREVEGNLRPPLPENDWHRERKTAFSELGCSRTEKNAGWIVSKEFCDGFDLILVHHNHHFIAANWDKISGRTVVWRTIGQEMEYAEDNMREYRQRGLRIVRWSPEEIFIERYIGADAVIRAAKNADDWYGWNGVIPRIVTFNNNFRARKDAMNFDFHQQCVAGIPFDLYGIGNDDVPKWRGIASPEDQQQLLRDHCAAFVTGTWPAPYTLGFVEAWMTGIPVVHVGRQRFSHNTIGAYEIDRLIKHGENGFLVDDVDEGRTVLRELASDQNLCQQISRKGRESAIASFGRATAIPQWSAFLTEHVV